MIIPDYKKGSIVNLMSSILTALGNDSSRYNQLEILRSKELMDSKNIVLIVLDGLGFKFLEQKGKNSFMISGLKGKMTSVFPSTTASAITTFITGTAPQQHAFTGWFMHLKEIGIISAILRFNPRIGGLPFTDYNIKVEDILNVKGFSETNRTDSYMITHNKIIKSAYTLATSKKSKRLGYTTMDGFFRQIKKAIKSNNRKKYIYAYWPDFDSISHKYGINSKEAETHFKEIDKKLSAFIDGIKGSDTTVIITADHGLIDTTKDNLIELEDHPKLKECLTLPLCGEPRLAYCYVHPSKTKQFEDYVRNKLNKFCKLYKSEELIKMNYYGLFKPNPRLKDRVGDYILVMKDKYIIKDKIPNQKRHFHIGNHGGLSDEEMLVPLIVFKRKKEK